MRFAIGKVGADAIGQGEIVTSITFIALRIVRNDERASAAHEEETHYFAPIVGVGALFERRERRERRVRIFQTKLRFTFLAEQIFRANSNVPLLVKKESKLIRQIQVGLVIGRRGKQHYL